MNARFQEAYFQDLFLLAVPEKSLYNMSDIKQNTRKKGYRLLCVRKREGEGL
jgi:hypothetical protein